MKLSANRKWKKKAENSTVSIINEALGQNEFLKRIFLNLISITAKDSGQRRNLWADAYTYTLAIEAVVTT